MSSYFKYSGPVRKLIYTTNPIEGLHRQIRKFTKSKGSFISTNALYEQVYCAIKKVGEKWAMRIHDWALTMSQLDMFFSYRVELKMRFDTVYLPIRVKLRDCEQM